MPGGPSLLTLRASFLLPLRGIIKNYAWGSRRFLAQLQGRPTPSAATEAELWMGAHASGPSLVLIGGDWVSLRDAIASDPVGFLGASSVDRFGGELSFLLKILAIEEPLSLQVHPDRERAVAGFARERADGVEAGGGNYADDRAKPETIVALERLWLLRGLLGPAEIERRFALAGVASMKEATALLVNRGASGLRDFLAGLLGMAGEPRTRLAAEMSAAAARSVELGLGRESPLYWLARLVELHPGDPAALAPLFLHLVMLEPGQGSFQPSGVLHSYLEGVGVEVMASSDNVVRAGLTVKPVDVAELLAIVDATPLAPVPIEPTSERELEEGPRGVARYPSPVVDFALCRVTTTEAGAAILDDAGALVIGLCTRGTGRVTAAARGESLDLAKGGAFVARAGAGSMTLEGELDVFTASVAPAPRRHELAGR